jgi:hypothetical protein
MAMNPADWSIWEKALFAFLFIYIVCLFSGLYLITFIAVGSMFMVCLVAISLANWSLEKRS